MTKLYATMLSFVATAQKKDEKGATAVEYGLLVALIAGAIILAIILLGGNLSNLFNSIAGRLPGNAPAAP